MYRPSPAKGYLANFLASLAASPTGALFVPPFSLLAMTGTGGICFDMFESWHLGAVCTFVLVFVFYEAYSLWIWHPLGGLDKHMVQETMHASVPFMKRRVIVRPPHIMGRRKVWKPNILKEAAMKRGLCTVGTSLRRAMIDTVTWWFEFKLTMLFWIIKIDLSLSKIRASSQTSEMNYLAIVNTSLACYITNDNGHIEMYDTYLPCGDNDDGSAMRHIYKITIELDHEKKICACARIQQVESYKHEILIEDTKEISAIICVCAAYKTHVNVHYFANGVAETDKIWQLANQSTQTIQAFNYAGVFTTGPFSQLPTEINAQIFVHNLAGEGLPFHHHLESLLGETSYTHIMAKNARHRLIKMGLPPVHVESIVAATVLHAAEHHYLDRYAAKDCRSSFLKKDFTLLRNTVFRPVKYQSKRMLCKQYPNDPVCRAIYEECNAVDKEFADNSLCMNVAV